MASSSAGWREHAARGECPEEHELLPWTATKEGACCGCGKRFPAGEQVMDCRRCDWFLCEMCCPRYGKTPSIWGTLSQLPFYAAERLSDAFDASDAALDAFAEQHDEKIDAALDAVEQAIADVGHRAAKVPAMTWVSDLIFDEILPDVDPEEAKRELKEGTEEQQQEAKELVAEFCENWREVCAEPTDSDLGAFWSRCAVLYSTVLEPGPLAEALAVQLRKHAASGEDGSWQPPLRALCVLRDFEGRGAVGQAIAAAVAQRAGGRIRALAKIAECADEADRAGLALLGEVGALDGAWTPKSRPGISVEVISGNSLRLHSGVTYELTPCGLNKVAANFRGRQQVGELAGAELVWSGGTSWIRHSGPIPAGQGSGGASGSSSSPPRGPPPRQAALAVQREPQGAEFVVVVEKPPSNPSAKLGLDITFREALGVALRIKHVKEGLVGEWNFFNPEKEVKAEDWIVGVNGARGSADRMLEEIQASTRFELAIVREGPEAQGACASAAQAPSATSPAAAAAPAAAPAPPATEARRREEAIAPPPQAPRPSAEEVDLIGLDPSPSRHVAGERQAAQVPMVKLMPPPQAASPAGVVAPPPGVAGPLADLGPLL